MAAVRSTYRPAPPLGLGLGCEPERMLARIARQSGCDDPEGCDSILSLLAASRLVRGHLQGVLGRVTEVNFAVLVTLYAFDPEPTPSVDLARHARIGRAALSGALASLRAAGLVRLERDALDKRTSLLRLTDEGRQLVERAVPPFLVATSRCAEALGREECAALAGACARLGEHFRVSPA